MLAEARYAHCTPSCRAMPSRVFQDPSGVLWEIFEVHRLNHRPNTVRPSLSSGWLVFVSSTEKRRLPGYPATWMQLADDELHKLLRSASLAPDPRYPVTLPSDGRGLSRDERARQPQTDLDQPRQPTPPPVSPPPPGVLSSIAVGIETLVRTQARQARRDGVLVVEGMMVVKRALADAGHDVAPQSLRMLRKIFVEEYYFSR